MEDIRSVTGRSVNDIKQFSARQKKVEFMSVQNSQEDEKDLCLTKEKTMANDSFENAAQYIQKDHQES